MEPRSQRTRPCTSCPTVTGGQTGGKLKALIAMKGTLRYNAWCRHRSWRRIEFTSRRAAAVGQNHLSNGPAGTQGTVIGVANEHFILYVVNVPDVRYGRPGVLIRRVIYEKTIDKERGSCKEKGSSCSGRISYK